MFDFVPSTVSNKVVVLVRAVFGRRAALGHIRRVVADVEARIEIEIRRAVPKLLAAPHAVVELLAVRLVAQERAVRVLGPVQMFTACTEKRPINN